jgi:putative salt-induced outer membrane protein YdiY
MCLPPLRVSLVVCLLVIGWASVASADEIRLKNGDRYTGKVVSLAKGVLRFDTGHGTLDVPWADISVATIDSPIVVSVSGAPPLTATTMSVADGQVVVAPGTTVPASTITSLTRPDGPTTVVGGANAGLLSTGGNTDVNSLRVDGDVVVKARQNRYTASGVVNRAVDRGVETARNATATGRYDRFLNSRFYANVDALFTRDRFRDLDLRTALGVGLGYQVADTARVHAGLEAGYGYVNERFFVAADDSYHAVRDTVSVDVFAVGKRLTLFHRHDGFFGLTGDDNLFVQTRNGVRVGLGGGLVATIQYDVDYDRSPAPGRKTTDRALGVTFGYRF